MEEQDYRNDPSLLARTYTVEQKSSRWKTILLDEVHSGLPLVDRDRVQCRRSRDKVGKVDASRRVER